jgi:hypothetical protein
VSELTIGPSCAVSRLPGALAERVNDDLIRLGPRMDQYVALDGIGRRVWELLERPQRVDQLSAVLQAEYREVTPGEITRDVMALVSRLQAEGLVRVAPPA